MLTMEVLCHKDFSTATVRDVPYETKLAVFADYGIADCAQHATDALPDCGTVYEIDHLIALTIGGSNDQKNLWPQSYIAKPWNAHIKDQLEVRLHYLVCKGQLTLADAQKQISSNWIDAYRKWMPSKNPYSKLNKRWAPKEVPP